ncbi:MAG: AAA family ATPase [Porcipelethomonas sp.]
MENTIITIERQYASGGIEIGKKVAERLNVPCYSSEILEQAAKNCSIPPEYVESTQEDVSQSLLYRLSVAAKTGKAPDEVVTKADILYKEIKRIITEMAEKSSCVIIGRCSDYILRNRENCLNVFIHSGFEARIKRAVEEYGVNEDIADYIIRKNDRRRESFYNASTGRTWGVKENYHLCLNSEKFGTDSCVDMIINSLEYLK